MRVLISILIILLLACTASAANQTIFTLRDIANNNLVSNVAVYIIKHNVTYSYYLAKDEVLRPDFDTKSNFVIKADDYNTKGNDYYQLLPSGAVQEGISTIYLNPVSSLRGIVKDKLDNVVPFAKLKFACEKQFAFPAFTDEFGSFYLDYMPVGSCMIYASFGNATGSTDVFSYRGNVSQITILLDGSIIPISKQENNAFWLIIILIIIVAIFFLAWLVLANKKKTGAADIEKKLDKSSEKIFETLNEKEQKVVDYLLKNNHCSMQSNVRHATSLPRTSLCRIIDSLEKKRILKVEKNGKSVKLSLTDFFLDKG